ncbi:hypothetical protein HK28_11425 [Acetobacter sp. DsW_063]|nr:hypothetical protein HK28_11425 [Acetobacter sp. DsW_063]
MKTVGVGVGTLAAARCGLLHAATLQRAQFARPNIETVAQITAATAIGTPTFIVAGNAAPARWAPLIASSFSETLSTDSPIVLRKTGGQDGVTGANLFDSLASADESGSALLAPGAAILAAQAGDPRVHFDYQRWLPVLLSVSAPIAVGRVDFRRSLRTMLKDRPVRVAVSAPNGLELPTMLALTILSMRVIPISGFGGADAAIGALRRGEVDVVQLPADSARPDLLQSLAAEGFEPLFATTPTVDPSVSVAQDFTTRYEALRGRAPTHPLYPAFKATAAAACIDMALVLPMLTPPAQAARWRHAATLAAALPEAAAMAKNDGGRLIAGTDDASVYAALAPDLSAILALRRWLAEHGPSWRVG